jgi:hypothetical protein
MICSSNRGVPGASFMPMFALVQLRQQKGRFEARPFIL